VRKQTLIMHNFKYSTILNFILWYFVGWSTASQENELQIIAKNAPIMKIILSYLNIHDNVTFIQTNKEHHQYFPALLDLMHAQYQQFLHQSLIISKLSTEDIYFWQKYPPFLQRYVTQLTAPNTPIVFFRPSSDTSMVYPEILCSEMWLDQSLVETKIFTFFQHHPHHLEVTEYHRFARIRESSMVYWGRSDYSLVGLPSVYDPHANQFYLFFINLMAKGVIDKQARQSMYHIFGIHPTEHTTHISVYLQVPVMLVFTHPDHQMSTHIERISEWNITMFIYGGYGPDKHIELCVDNKTTQHSMQILFNGQGVLDKIHIQKMGPGVSQCQFKAEAGGVYTSKLYTHDENPEYTMVYAFYHVAMGIEY